MLDAKYGRVPYRPLIPTAVEGRSPPSPITSCGCSPLDPIKRLADRDLYPREPQRDFKSCTSKPSSQKHHHRSSRLSATDTGRYRGLPLAPSLHRSITHGYAVPPSGPPPAPPSETTVTRHSSSGPLLIEAARAALIIPSKRRPSMSPSFT